MKQLQQQQQHPKVPAPCTGSIDVQKRALLRRKRKYYKKKGPGGTSDYYKEVVIRKNDDARRRFSRDSSAQSFQSPELVEEVEKYQRIRKYKKREKEKARKEHVVEPDVDLPDLESVSSEETIGNSGQQQQSRSQAHHFFTCLNYQFVRNNELMEQGTAGRGGEGEGSGRRNGLELCQKQKRIMKTTRPWPMLGAFTSASP
ncbi:unnamed protein product [Gongylonema pulchrum]|uniref:Uncharacterized protein n=1 Tax=Gongylonema pulchrum TaxID=637853 RepID=A0A183CZZ0_9BILA|nr:unnamed protein product [Gongylonema pulchrum]